MKTPENPEIRYLGDLQRLTIQPGDMFVLTLDFDIDEVTTDRIRAMAQNILGGAHVMVLAPGMQLGAVRTKPVEDSPPTLARIEAKLDILISALAEDDEEDMVLTLDGQQEGGERDQSQAL